MNQKLRNLRNKAGFGLASSLVVLAGALASHAATAQDDEGAMVEEVIVSGTRVNLQNAQDIKREADTFVDAISAEDIGTLPDRSVLEAIQRLPGVSVERFAGPDDPDHFSVEGSGAIIRGMTQTRSEFNGRDSFTANSGRGLSFQDVSPELMGGVDVFKNQTADMIEGGIGGTISLKTRKPFDTDGRQLGFNMDYSYGDIAEEWSPTFSGLYSDRWDTDLGEFGFLISIADSQLFGESHGLQSDAYSMYNAGNIPGAERFVDAAQADDNPVVWMPNSANALIKFDDRKRQGLATSAQWKNPEDTVQVTAEYIRSDSKLVWYEKAIKYQGSYPTDADDVRSTALDHTTINFNDDGLFQSGTLKFVNWIGSTDAENAKHFPSDGRNGQQFGQKMQFDSRINDTKSLVEDMNLNVEWQAADNLELSGDFQYIKADTKQDDLAIHTASFAGQQYDISGDTPSLTLIEPWFGYRDANREEFLRDNPGFSEDPEGDANYFQDPNNYYWRSGMEHYERSEGELTALRLDGTYYFEDVGILKSVKAGVRYSDREQIVRRSGYNWKSVGPEWASSTPAGWLLDEEGRYADQYQYAEYVDWSDFHGGDALNIPGNKTIHASEEFVRMVMGASPAREIIDAEGGEWADNRLSSRDGVDAEYGTFTAGEISYTREENEALYVRIDFGNDAELRYSGNIGMRYAKLTRRADGAIIYPDLNIDLARDIAPAGLALPLTGEAVMAYVNQQVTEGEYATVEDALEADANAWIDEPINYLTADERNFGNDAELPTTTEADFNMFLPSFNLKVEMTDDLIARFAVAKAVALPDISDVRNRVDVGVLNYNPTSIRMNDLPEIVEGETNPYEGMIDNAYIKGWTGSGGNPHLRPMQSVQYDVALEWYFSDVGQLSGTIFHKNLSDYFIKGSNYQLITNPDTGVTQLVDVDSTINGGSAKMDGLELSYQQFFDGMFEGFGIQATYTYIDASGVPNNQVDFQSVVDSEGLDNSQDTGLRVNLDNIPLQGQSEHTANVVGMFENDAWNARLAYNWRSKYLLTTRDVISKVPLYYDDHGQLDGSLFYDVNDYITVGLQLTNITNSQSKTLMVLNDEMLEAGRSWFVSDRRASFVVKGSF
ncbi:TonB-dependent receptor [Teredinibacter haidensis]|uniref:TonB-dependent receptor n=1 Tax=Teredinibacter haidensis TaxID=2731755 RepID=UPI0009489FA1|nr:TonB-dependent receptor [Teredinibacter haidensis]